MVLVLMVLKGEVYNWLMALYYNIKQSFFTFTSKLLSGKKLINGDGLYKILFLVDQKIERACLRLTL